MTYYFSVPRNGEKSHIAHLLLIQQMAGAGHWFCGSKTLVWQR